MKKLTLLLIMVLVAGSLFAQLDPFMPPNPITFAQGGAFTANAEGMNAFYYNPAGFRQDEGELTLTSIGVYSLIDRSLIELMMGVVNSSSASSRQSEDLPLPPELLGFVDDLSVVGTWLGDMSPEASDAAMTAAINAIDDIDPELAAAISDPENLSEEDFLVVVLNSPIFSEGDDGDANITNIIAAMDAAATNPALGANAAASVSDPTYLGATWEDDMNSSAAEAEDAIPSGEMRVGAMAGIAYVGNGLGFGLFLNADGTFDGETILSTKGRLMTSITLAGGLSLPIGPFSVGAQIRPTILGYSDVNVSDLLIGAASGEVNIDTIMNASVFSGFYLGLDAGALYDLGPFTFGVAVKDLLPIPVAWTSFQGYEAYAQALSSGSFFGDSVADRSGLYQVPPMKINVGAQFHPELGALNWIVDPRVNVDIHDLLGFFRYINQEENPLDADTATLGTGYSFIERLHLGAEAAFFGGLLSARAGFYGDYLSAGIGAHLLFLDINAGIGLSDLETRGDELGFQQLGFSMEAAIRF